MLPKVLSAQHAVIAPDQLQPVGKIPLRMNDANEMQPVDHSERPSHPLPGREDGSQARINSLAPVPLGTSSNVYGGLRGQQNQVYANDSLDEVLFIHRQDVSIWGGGPANSGMFRYDVSVDGGLTFTPDIGVVNPQHSRSGRYPQITGYNPGSGTNPLQTKAVYTGPTFFNNQWDGFVGGVSNVALSQNPFTTETYNSSSNAFLPGGLCNGLPGEFWMVDQLYDQTQGNLLDTVRVYKGTWNASTLDVDWVTHANLVPNWNTSFNGDVQAIAPSIAFSPDGQTGWIGMLGDLAGGPDSVMSPILIKSTDGGATWGTPVEVDLSANAWVYDSLRTLWVDSMLNPISTGRPGAAFEFDLVVDNQGNPHFATVIGSATTMMAPQPGYIIYTGLAKYLVDVTSTNGGASFMARQVAPILTFRNDFGTPTSITLDNCPQVSRSADGDFIFYAWADSDTALVTGMMNGIGFGQSSNLAPNLMISGFQVSTNMQTCYRGITNGDFTWDGRALRPTMAPEVLQDDSSNITCFKLPIVLLDMVQNDPLGQTRYYYFGNDAVLSTQDFTLPGGLTPAWGQSCTYTYTPCAFSNNSGNQLTGRVWSDLNGNGAQDPGEPALAGKVVTANPGSYATLTDANGDYQFTLPVGTYSVATATPLYNTQTLPTGPGTYSVPFTSLGNSSTGNDFGFQPNPNADDLEVAMSPHSVLPGVNLPHYIRVKNNGTTAQTPVLTYQHDTLFNYLGASVMASSYTAATSTATWNLPTLAPGQTFQIIVDLGTPTWAMLGDTTYYYASVTIPPNEQTPNNNQDTVVSYVQSSFDPNDKLVTPAGTGPQGAIQNGTTLEYTVRFQNTGNAPASLVVIKDTLDPKLDISTFQALGASHPHFLTLSPPNVVEWRFPNINLPDSATNFAASQGQVSFRIAPLPNLNLGTALENNASIYFDFNAPVVTNTTRNTIDHPTGVLLPQPVGQVLVYPNPFEAQTTFVLPVNPNGSYDFALYNVEGRKVHTADGLEGERYVFSRDDLPAGMYFFRFVQKGKAFAQGKVMIH